MDKEIPSLPTEALNKLHQQLSALEMRVQQLESSSGRKNKKDTKDTFVPVNKKRKLAKKTSKDDPIIELDELLSNRGKKDDIPIENEVTKIEVPVDVKEKKEKPDLSEKQKKSEARKLKKVASEERRKKRTPEQQKKIDDRMAKMRATRLAKKQKK